MQNRIIKSRARTSSTQLTDCLSSLLVLELLHPSKQLYLISPWISNVPLLTNRFGQFRALMPEMSKSQLGLADILCLLHERGTLVRVVCLPPPRQQPSTADFLRRLPEEVEWRYDEVLHEKGLLTDHFYLRGSMNFTYFGVNINDEHIELTSDPATVATALLEALRSWETLNGDTSL